MDGGVCEGSGLLVRDRAAIVHDDNGDWLVCPSCRLAFSLPTGGDWDTPTIPNHFPQTTALALGAAFDAMVDVA